MKSELGGNFESVIVGLMMPTAHYCAKQLHKAMKGLGTDEETLVEVLCSRSQEEVALIASAYAVGTDQKCDSNYLRLISSQCLDYGNSLEDDIKSETSGPLLRLLVLTLQVAKIYHFDIN